MVILVFVGSPMLVRKASRVVGTAERRSRSMEAFRAAFDVRPKATLLGSDRGPSTAVARPAQSADGAPDDPRSPYPTASYTSHRSVLAGPMLTGRASEITS